MDRPDSHWIVCPKCKSFIKRPQASEWDTSETARRRRRSVYVDPKGGTVRQDGVNTIMTNASGSYEPVIAKSSDTFIEIEVPSLSLGLQSLISCFCQNCGGHFTYNPSIIPNVESVAAGEVAQDVENEWHCYRSTGGRLSSARSAGFICVVSGLCDIFFQLS